MVTNSESINSRQPVPTVITEASTIEHWNNPTSQTPIQPPSTYRPRDFRWFQDRNPGDPFIPGTILPKSRQLPDARRESEFSTSVISAYVFVFPSYQDPSPHTPPRSHPSLHRNLLPARPHPQNSPSTRPLCSQWVANDGRAAEYVWDERSAARGVGCL